MVAIMCNILWHSMFLHFCRNPQCSIQFQRLQTAGININRRPHLYTLGTTQYFCRSMTTCICCRDIFIAGLQFQLSCGASCSQLCSYTVSQKNIPDIFSCNSRKYCQIFIIFGICVTEKVGNQEML